MQPEERSTLRFTVSLHDHPFEHLDLFLEDPGAPRESALLSTWRAPGSGLDALVWPGVSERLPEHRRLYLDHEGPVETDRGSLRRLDTGTYQTRRRRESELVVDLRGDRLRGRLSLWADGSGGWRSSWRERGGLFVAIEGIDGSGKSSAARTVAAGLRAAGHQVWLTREPTDEGFGAALRQRLVEANHRVPLAMALGFAADRAEHLFGETGILARRARGEVVICDRYKLSSLAYQSQAGVDPAVVSSLNQTFPDPDLTVLFDVPAAVAVERLARGRGRGGDLYERAGFLEGVADRYHECVRGLAATGDTVARAETLDGSAPPEAVAHRLTTLIERSIEEAPWHRSRRPE